MTGNITSERARAHEIFERCIGDHRGLKREFMSVSICLITILDLKKGPWSKPHRRMSEPDSERARYIVRRVRLDARLPSKEILRSTLLLLFQVL